MTEMQLRVEEISGDLAHLDGPWSVPALAEAAIGVLEARGHCHGDLVARDGSVCLVGAAAVALGVDIAYHAVQDAAPEFVAAVVSVIGDSIAAQQRFVSRPVEALWRWNDDFDNYAEYKHGKDDAVALLRRVAESS